MQILIDLHYALPILAFRYCVVVLFIDISMKKNVLFRENYASFMNSLQFPTFVSHFDSQKGLADSTCDVMTRGNAFRITGWKPPGSLESVHIGAVLGSFGALFGLNWNTILNKQSSPRWFWAPSRSWDVIMPRQCRVVHVRSLSNNMKGMFDKSFRLSLFHAAFRVLRIINSDKIIMIVCIHIKTHHKTDWVGFYNC